MEKTRKCPYCGEEIMADARKCKHCGEWLEGEPVQEQPPKEDKKEAASPACQKATPTQSEKTKPQALKEEIPHSNSKKWLLAIAPIVVVLVGVGLYLFGAFGNESKLNGLQSKNGSSTIGLKQSEDEIKKEIEKQVLDAYKTQEIYNLMTSEFEEAEKAAIAAEEPGYVGCIDWDFFYCTNEDPNLTKVVSVQPQIVQDDKAHVYVTLDYDWDDSETQTIVLVMVRDKKGHWLIDDVRTTGEYSNSIKGLMIECANSDRENGEDETKAEIERQVLEAYLTYTSLENIDRINLEESPDFQAARDAVSTAENASGFLCMEVDCYTESQDPACRRVSDVRAEMVDENRAHVYVTLKDLCADERDSNPIIVILSMIRKNGEGKWLVDDVDNTKELMIECAKSLLEEVKKGSGDEGNNAQVDGKMVVIDGDQLRLRLGPSTSSETLKWGDGSNRHPEVGEKFKYLGESGDFYKIDYKGNEVWVSKQFSHVE